MNGANYLDDQAGRPHIDDTEYLGRLMQLPTIRPVPEYDRPERLVLSWAQPDMGETSDK